MGGFKVDTVAGEGGEREGGFTKAFVKNDKVSFDSLSFLHLSFV